MQIKYRTKYWKILPKELVEEIKRLQKIDKNQISNEEEEELRKRLFDDSLDLRLKKESISAIARSQLGRNDDGEINDGNLDLKTMEFLKKKSIQIDCLGDLISSNSKYWFSHPQTYNYSITNQRLHKQLPYWGMVYVLTHLFIPGISFILYPPLIADAPKTIKERVASDIEWMIDNQCTMGVSKYDLFHAHMCFELENDHFRSETLHNANQSVMDMRKTFPILLRTCSITTPFFEEYKRKLHSLYNAIFIMPYSEMLLLYHSYERVNPNHPCYTNRTVLTKNSDRFCVIPVLDNLGVGDDEINGISGLSANLFFRINRSRGKTDRDLKNLEIYVTPPVLRGL